jgi:hypothetical protein
VVHASIDQRDLPLCVIDDDGFPGTNEVVHNRGVFVDQHVRPGCLARVFN